MCLVATHGSASFFSISKKNHLLLNFLWGVMAKIQSQSQKKKKKVYFQLAPEPGSWNLKLLAQETTWRFFGTCTGETLLIELKRHCLSVCFVALIIHLLWTWYIFFFFFFANTKQIVVFQCFTVVLTPPTEILTVFKVKSGRNWQLDKLSDWVSFSMGYS